MKYLRDNKGIAIAGSSQKRKLMNIGYYHGYKGYRYIKSPTNQIPYTKFEELLAIYEFDSQMKGLFYPCVMTIETALKNYVLEEIVSETNSDSFITIYSKLLDNYKAFSTVGKSYKDSRAREKAEERFQHELKRRLDLRTRIYKIQADAFGNQNKIADHYLRQDKNLPIWGIFELLSLGEFGHFVSCLNQPCRAKISRRIGIQQSDDSNAMMPQRLIYATKDLRNAIAHNDVIFDTRFRTNSIDKQVSNAISNATDVKNLTFESITDYLVLVIYQMKLIGVTKTEMKRVIASYTETVDRLRISIPISVFSRIVYTDNKPKVTALKKFVSA
jgi:abortive infection bacteriophage resistance protein